MEKTSLKFYLRGDIKDKQKEPNTLSIFTFVLPVLLPT